jgi:hypothetical protein
MFSNIPAQILGTMGEYNITGSYQTITQSGGGSKTVTYMLTPTYSYSIIGNLFPLFVDGFMIGDDIKLSTPIGLTGNEDVSTDFFVTLHMALGFKFAFVITDDIDFTFIYHHIDLRGHSKESTSMSNNFLRLRFTNFMFEYGINKKLDEYNVPYNSLGLRYFGDPDDGAGFIGLRLEKYDTEKGKNNFSNNKDAMVMSVEFGVMF